jgi:O-antigen/teichoic acid export membrane protein
MGYLVRGTRDRSPPLSAADGAQTASQVKQRAAAGLVVVGSRGIAVLLIGFASYAALARLLTPRDFGLIAIGVACTAIVGLLADGGLGGALIRRAEPPTREELQALTGLQVGMATGLAILAAGVGLYFGQAAWIPVIMTAAMPIVALQMSGRILLERSLSYRPLAVLEITQVVCYHASAVGLALAGFGARGVAVAWVIRALIGTLFMARLSPVGLVLPKLSWRLIRPIVGFGVRFQAVNGIFLGSEQGLNWMIPSLTSMSTLGLWSLARRLLEIPLLLIQTFGRVSFSSMSRLVALKQDCARLIERAVGIAAVGIGIALTGLVGSAPGLIPGIFGDAWDESAAALPWACLALAVSGSVGVATQGYLYAVGDASAVLRATAVHAVVLLVVTLPLLPVVGVVAVGVGWLAASAIESVLLVRATRRWVELRLTGGLIPPIAIGCAAAAVGWVVANAGGGELRSGLAGGITSVTLYVAALLVLRRGLLVDAARFFAGSLRATRVQLAAPQAGP